jgi:hypothetical protein
MEPESSLPCSQEPSTGHYSEPDQSNPYHPIMSKIHFNIVHPPTPWCDIGENKLKFVILITFV